MNDEMKKRAELLIIRSLEEAFSSGQREWSVEPISQDVIDREEFIVLTISSYSFRLLVFLYFTLDDQVKAYVQESTGARADAISNAQCYDFLSELGNNICGSFKREMGVVYSHLGMSTPNIMSADAAKHIDRRKCSEHLAQRAVSQGLVFFSGLLICVEKEDITFPKLEDIPDENKGELELF